MKKKVSALLAALLVCLLILPATVETAYADYDEIVGYDVTVQPNVDDGSLSFTVSFDWKALEELPYGQELKIGVPNGSIREVKALTANIEKLEFDNSYMYVYLTQKYRKNETFSFSYSWIQEYMYTLGSNGSVTYDYTPGWFDDIKVDRMSVTWLNPAGVSGSATWTADDQSRWSAAGSTLTGTNLPYGSQVHISAVYPSWPVELSWENSSENLPDDDWGGGGGDNHSSGADILVMLVVIFIIVMILLIIVSAASRRDGYAGGFGTHYVYYNNLWYPAGPNGLPKPGSVGTAHKPKPKPSSSSSSSHSSGFGGGSHGGGGFGSSGFGGGSHCACASSCACACACACAGGGRAGCSAKNLYGAVHLDEKLSRKLEQTEE